MGGRMGPEAARKWAAPSAWRERAGATGTAAVGLVLRPEGLAGLGTGRRGGLARTSADLRGRDGLGSMSSPGLVCCRPSARPCRGAGGRRAGPAVGCLESR